MKSLIELLLYLSNIYEHNNDPDNKFYSICKQFSFRSKAIVKINCIIYGIIQIGATWPSIIIILFTGETILSMRCYVYGFDDRSFITLAYNIILCTLNIYIGCLTDALIFLTFGNYSLVSTCIQREIESFEKVLVINQINNIDIKNTMTRIILMYEKYIE